MNFEPEPYIGGFVLKTPLQTSRKSNSLKAIYNCLYITMLKDRNSLEDHLIPKPPSTLKRGFSKSKRLNRPASVYSPDRSVQTLDGSTGIVKFHELAAKAAQHIEDISNQLTASHATQLEIEAEVQTWAGKDPTRYSIESTISSERQRSVDLEKSLADQSLEYENKLSQLQNRNEQLSNEIIRWKETGRSKQI